MVAYSLQQELGKRGHTISMFVGRKYSEESNIKLLNDMRSISGKVRRKLAYWLANDIDVFSSDHILKTPEFKVSSSGEFMEEDEFMAAIEDTSSVFLLAESGSEVLGFIYANRQDPERASKTKWACLVYLVVKQEYRGRGVAQKLYDSCIEELKKYGITRLYGWANSESDGSIIKFMRKNGFNEGHKYIWMDKNI